MAGSVWRRTRPLSPSLRHQSVVVLTLMFSCVDQKLLWSESSGGGAPRRHKCRVPKIKTSRKKKIGHLLRQLTSSRVTLILCNYDKCWFCEEDL